MILTVCALGGKSEVCFVSQEKEKKIYSHRKFLNERPEPVNHMAVTA